MAKEKTAYVCSECGYDSAKWMGKCPACGQWNTFKEVRLGTAGTRTAAIVSAAGSPAAIPIADITATEEARIDLGDGELNRVLGGGLVKGSLILLGGEPGIGKSTLTLQTIMRLGSHRVLYVSGEESARQIKMRADRLMPSPQALPSRESADKHSPLRGETEGGFKSPLILCETRLEQILDEARRVQPDIMVIDSIQTISSEDVESSAGSLSQVRECATRLLAFAKGTGTSVLLIGHITKEGTLAGPKVLEHIVDAVLQFEGDQHHLYRILRGIKNRFGSTAELGIYEMRGDGLREVSNPSELLLAEHEEGMSGTAVACAIEGVRPLLIETQALVSSAAYGTPQRTATGFDTKRLNMLLAVLEKRVGFKLMQKDVFLNIAGGLRVTDPGIDLSVIAAVLSSNVDTGIERGVCMTGEVGLSGEIRPVARIEQRIAEAQKLGFQEIVIPQHNMTGLAPDRYTIRITPVRRVEQALRILFG